jgi:hypothetical protein
MRVYKKLKPPGDCSNGEHIFLQSQVNANCKSGIGCNGTDSCQILFEKMGMHGKCIQARSTINAKCFRGGDKGHNEALTSHINGLQKCWNFYKIKCKNWKPPVVVPVPEKKPEKKPIVDESFMKKMEQLTGLTGAALIIYLIISEGSRLFPPRNLVPVP